jgi:ABC-type uncharacterized transport system substrate-binding protein
MLTDCYRGFTDELSRAGLTPDQGLELKAMNAQGDMATLVSMVTAAAAARPDLLAVTSTPTLQAAVKVANNLPILFTVVANPVLAGAGKSLTDHLANVTGVSTMSDYQGMAQVLKECLPAAKRVGTLFATSEDNSIYNKDSMAAALRAVGVELVAVGTATPAEIADAALSLMGKDVEAICQVNSNMHDAGFAAIGQAAHKARKPLFGFTTGQVRKGGAAVGVCRDYEQAGRDMARLAVRVLAGESPAAIPIQVVSKTRILVNPKSAELCGLTIPPSLLQRAEVVSGD